MYLPATEASLGLCQTSMIELFAEIVSSFQPFTIFAKIFFPSDVQQSPNYDFVLEYLVAIYTYLQ